MPANAPYCVVLDSNIWVSERLLQTSLGSALLYVLAGATASIALPEVVELELNGLLPDLAEKAITDIGKDASSLRHLSGQQLRYTAPSKLAIQEGIERRWTQLTGLLKRVPFTHDQAKAGLSRVIKKLPPSGPNNEQFRDCCIWEAARTVGGVCSYDPNLGEVSEIEIREWNMSLDPRDGRGLSGTSWSEQENVMREFSPKYVRVIR
jgi:hypothetical protein